MEAFKDFVTKAADLYLAAPAFFNWAAPLLVLGLGAVIWFAWWLGGKLSEGEIAELKGKVEVLEQRVTFGKERADAATKEAADAKADFQKLRGEIANQAPREILQNSADVLEVNLDRLLTANSSTSSALGFISTGFNERGGLNWRPIGEDEKHLLEPLPIPESQKNWMKKTDK